LLSVFIALPFLTNTLPPAGNHISAGPFIARRMPDASTLPAPVIFGTAGSTTLLFSYRTGTIFIWHANLLVKLFMIGDSCFQMNLCLPPRWRLRLV
jgi:hypothetical protein